MPKVAWDGVEDCRRGDAGKGIDQNRRKHRRLVVTGNEQHRSVGKGAHMPDRMRRFGVANQDEEAELCCNQRKQAVVRSEANVR